MSAGGAVEGAGGPGHVVEAREAMGTRFEVLLPGRDRVRLRSAAEEALDEAERLEAQLSAYRIESELSGINAYAASGPVRVEPRLFALLKQARRVWEETAGAFDPTVRPLLRAWGFVGGTGSVPDESELAAARQLTGMHLVELDEEATTVRFLREGVSLDPGAIGKGYAIDRMRETLEDAGIHAALLHGGTSTVLGLGAPPDEEGWRVALRDPLRGPDAAIGTVILHDRALSVSAPHGKAFETDSRLYGHVLDPRSGEPVRGALLAAAAHASAALTDALSTALLVLGAEGLPLLAERYPEADFLCVVRRGEGAEAESAGPGLWRLTLEPPFRSG